MEQLELLRYGVEVLERLGVPYALVGSYGTLAYGEARFTQDIDVVVDLPEEKVREFCTAFPAPEWYVSETAARVGPPPQAVQRDSHNLRREAGYHDPRP